jgi:hypothetical protein
MIKPIFNKNGMKMIIKSGFKEFDNKTNLITTGNVISNTQYSSYIRPYNEIINNSYIAQKGDFLKYDLQYFKNVNQEILNILKDENRKNSMILYQFSVNNKVIGHILTDKYYNKITSYIVYRNYEKYDKRINCIKPVYCSQ